MKKNKKSKKFLKDEITIKVRWKEELIKSFIISIIVSALLLYYGQLIKFIIETADWVSFLELIYPCILIVCLTITYTKYIINGGANLEKKYSGKLMV